MVTSMESSDGFFFSDTNPSFCSQQWQQFCLGQHIHYLRAPAYMQRANGLSERSTLTLPQIVRQCVASRGGQWSDWVQNAIYWNLPDDVLHLSPNQVQFGCSLWLLGLPPLIARTFLPAFSGFSTSVEVACPMVVEPSDRQANCQQLILHWQEVAQRRSSSHVHPVTFHPGDLIYVFDYE